MIDPKRVFRGTSFVYVDVATLGTQTLAICLTLTDGRLDLRFASRAKKGKLPPFKSLTTRRIRGFCTLDGNAFTGASLNFVSVKVVDKYINHEQLVAVVLANPNILQSIAIFITTIAMEEGYSVHTDIAEVLKAFLEGTVIKPAFDPSSVKVVFDPEKLTLSDSEVFEMKTPEEPEETEDEEEDAEEDEEGEESEDEDFLN